MNHQKATFFVLIILVIGFFVVSMITISKNGELQDQVQGLKSRVTALEESVKLMSGRHPGHDGR